MRRWIVPLCLLVLVNPGGARAQSTPEHGRIVIATSAPVLIGDPVQVRLEDLTPGSMYRLVTEFNNLWGVDYRSRNTFVADGRGRVDLAVDAPTDGSYVGADQLGVFWSALRTSVPPSVGPMDLPADSVLVSLTLEQDRETLDERHLTLWVASPGVTTEEIREDGVVAALYRPAKAAGPTPLVVLVGGSGGGMTWQREVAAALASRGYLALAVAYFYGDGLPESLSEIPLEYFRRAVTIAKREAVVDAEHVAMMGLSRGAEAALLAASHFPEITGVVAYSPSFVSFMGQKPPSFPLIPSWTYDGTPVAYVPTREIRLYRSTDNEAERHLRYLIVNAARVPEATIPVERINGPVLLFSGGADPLWPSRLMAELIAQRLSERGFGFPFHHVNFAGAGHVFARPGYQPTVPGGFSGGDPRANAHAQVESWRRTLEFLDEWRSR